MFVVVFPSAVFANVFYFYNVSGGILCLPYAAQLAVNHTQVLLKVRAKHPRTENDSKADQAKVKKDRPLRGMPTWPILTQWFLRYRQL